MENGDLVLQRFKDIKYNQKAEAKEINTGESHLSWIFWKHENLSGLRVIWLIQSYFHSFI